MHILLSIVIVVFIFPAVADNVHSGIWDKFINKTSSAAFPIDCPECPLFRKGRRNVFKVMNEADCKQYKSNPKKVPVEIIKQHIEEIKRDFLPQFKMSLDHQMCLMKIESGFKMNAANCESTARGLGQVIEGTGREVLEQGACAKVNKNGLDWAKSARSSKFQVFMSMCALLSKSRGGPINREAIKRYYGSKKDNENNAYYDKINKCAHKGAWSYGNK